MRTNGDWLIFIVDTDKRYPVDKCIFPEDERRAFFGSVKNYFELKIVNVTDALSIKNMSSLRTS